MKILKHLIIFSILFVTCSRQAKIEKPERERIYKDLCTTDISLADFERCILKCETINEEGKHIEFDLRKARKWYYNSSFEPILEFRELTTGSTLWMDKKFERAYKKCKRIK